MLYHVPRRIPPIVEDLTAQDMSTEAPNTLVSLRLKPLMAQRLEKSVSERTRRGWLRRNLSIEIMDFEGAMVHVRCCVFTHEEGVVVHKILASIDVRKHGYVFSCGTLTDVEEVCGDDVEMVGIP